MITTLLETMRALYNREINCGLQTFFDSGVTVWIGDDLNGYRVERVFTWDQIEEAAAWLRSEAEPTDPRR